jgi:DNA-binding XRE family transcriptional regulator
MVKCANCGLLALQNSDGRLDIANDDFREKGQYDINKNPEGTPRCFVARYHLHRERAGSEPRHSLAVIERERECNGFISWIPGLTPKEHWELDRERRLLEWHQACERDIRAEKFRHEYWSRSWIVWRLLVVAIVASLIVAAGLILAALIPKWLAEDERSEDTPASQPAPFTLGAKRPVAIKRPAANVAFCCRSLSSEPNRMPVSRHLGATPDVKRRELVAKLRAEGFSLSQIGDRLGVSKQAVCSLLHYVGIGTGPARQMVLCSSCRKPVGPGIGRASLNRYARNLTCISCVANDRQAPFGVRLRAARLAASLTAAELADRIGIQETKLLYWETKAKHPKESLVRRLAVGLGVEARTLLDGAT